MFSKAYFFTLCPRKGLQRISHTLTTNHHFYLGSASHVPMLEIPSFTKGKTQLSRAEVEKSSRLARVHIHVEHVIGQLRKKYKILQRTLLIMLIKRPSDKEVATIDKILVVMLLLQICPSVFV